MRFAGRGDYFSVLIAALVFASMKVVLINFDFFHTTNKSATIHENMEHAFNLRLRTA